MNCEILELFPKVIGIYKYDSENHEVVKNITDNIKKNITNNDSEYSKNLIDENLSHYYNQSGSSIFKEYEELKNLQEWCCSCARHFMTEVLDYVIDENNKILVTDSWMNVCEERAGQIKHNHHNCLVSGTYYVVRDEWVHAGLEFYRPNIELQPVISHTRNWGDNTNKYTRQIETLYPSSGELILWSSEFQHGYNGLTNFFEGRTTISMNFLPKTIDNGKYSFTIKS